MKKLGLHTAASLPEPPLERILDVHSSAKYLDLSLLHWQSQPLYNCCGIMTETCANEMDSTPDAKLSSRASVRNIKADNYSSCMVDDRVLRHIHCGYQYRTLDTPFDRQHPPQLHYSAIAFHYAIMRIATATAKHFCKGHLVSWPTGPTSFLGR